MPMNDFCWTSLFAAWSVTTKDDFPYTELTGVTVTIKGKQRKIRTVEISPISFLVSKGKPNQRGANRAPTPGFAFDHKTSAVCTLCPFATSGLAAKTPAA